MKPITKAEMREWLVFGCKTCNLLNISCPSQEDTVGGNIISSSARCRHIRRAIEKLIEKQGGKEK
jgi:hypothetical protein